MKFKIRTRLALALCAMPFFSMGLSGCQKEESSQNVVQPTDVVDGDALVNKAEARQPALEASRISVMGEAASVPKASDLERLKEALLLQEAIPAPAIQGVETNPAPLLKSAVKACKIAFNDPNILSLLPDHASYSFAPWYQENCGSGYWVSVTPTVQGHFHLNYQHPAFSHDFRVPSGKLGVYSTIPTRTAPKCESTTPPVVNTTTDAATVARFLSAHDIAEWVKIYTLTSSGVRKTFDLKSLYIWAIPNDGCYPSAGKLQLWIKKASTQQWLYWDNLTPGLTWNFPVDADNLDEIQLTSPSGSNGWGVDDIQISIR